MITMLAYLLATDGDGQKYFSVGADRAIAMIVLAYLMIFPAFVALRIRRPELERPFRVPGGSVSPWLVSIVATAGPCSPHLPALARIRHRRPGRLAACGLRRAAGEVRAARADAGRPRRGRRRGVPGGGGSPGGRAGDGQRSRAARLISLQKT